MAKDATIMLTKAAELFVQDLAANTAEYARGNGKRTIHT